MINATSIIHIAQEDITSTKRSSQTVTQTHTHGCADPLPHDHEAKSFILHCIPGFLISLRQPMKLFLFKNINRCRYQSFFTSFFLCLVVAAPFFLPSFFLLFFCSQSFHMEITPPQQMEIKWILKSNKIV